MSDLIDREAAKQLINVTARDINLATDYELSMWDNFDGYEDVADSLREMGRDVSKTLDRLLAALDALPRVGGEEPSVKRPPMLLACCKSTGNWQWYMHDTYMNKSAWINSVYCSSKSEDLLAVDRTASDPEALALHDADLAP